MKKTEPNDEYTFNSRCFAWRNVEKLAARVIGHESQMCVIWKPGELLLQIPDGDAVVLFLVRHRFVNYIPSHRISSSAITPPMASSIPVLMPNGSNCGWKCDFFIRDPKSG